MHLMSVGFGLLFYVAQGGRQGQGEGTLAYASVHAVAVEEAAGWRLILANQALLLFRLGTCRPQLTIQLLGAINTRFEVSITFSHH